MVPQIGGFLLSKLPFTKPPLELNDQVTKLQDRGLQGHTADIRSALLRMSYYRFSGYLWWFYETHQWEKIRVGTTVEDVLELYEFDNKLRLHVMSLAHSIEVWLRAAFTNRVSLKHGSMGYLEPDIYLSDKAFRKDLGKLNEMLRTDSPEVFVRSFHEKYTNAYPPIWMAAELMSFGLLSKWFANLKEDSLQKSIAREAGLSAPVLRSFLRLFSVLRNGAAHHSRLWNRHTALRGVHVRNPPELLKHSLDGADEACLNYVLSIAVYVVRQVDPGNVVVAELREHLHGAKEEWLAEMDFPLGFSDDPLWQP